LGHILLPRLVFVRRTDFQARHEHVVNGTAWDAVNAVDVRVRHLALLNPLVQRVPVDAEAFRRQGHFFQTTCQYLLLGHGLSPFADFDLSLYSDPFAFFLAASPFFFGLRGVTQP
jgi:hypothetical protein